MTRLHDRKIPAVQGRDRIDLKPLSNGDDRGVDRSESEIGVLLDQFNDPSPIFCGQVDASQFALVDCSEESHLSYWPKAGTRSARLFP